MTHVSPLYVGALACNVNVIHTTQTYIFRLREKIVDSKEMLNTYAAETDRIRKS